jgi:hypothetical protein
MQSKGLGAAQFWGTRTVGLFDYPSMTLMITPVRIPMAHPSALERETHRAYFQ